MQIYSIEDQNPIIQEYAEIVETLKEELTICKVCVLFWSKFFRYFIPNIKNRLETIQCKFSIMIGHKILGINSLKLQKYNFALVKVTYKNCNLIYCVIFRLLYFWYRIHLFCLKIRLVY